MRVYLDDLPVAEAGPTMSAALESLRARTEAHGRILIEILADGVPWSDSGSSTEASELRCRSMNRATLVRESFAGAADAVDPLIDAQRTAADLLQVGDHARAMDELRAVLGRWQEIRGVYDAASSLAGDSATAARAGSDDPAELVSELAGRLDELRRDIAADRWVEVADLLAYELSDLARRWGVTLRALAEGAAPAGAEGGRP